MLAVSGSDFVIVAGDTRVSTGYSINTRHGSKLTELYEARVERSKVSSLRRNHFLPDFSPLLLLFCESASFTVLTSPYERFVLCN